MSTPPSRRWFVWLPLLGAASWLTVFGDNSPAEAPALPLKPPAPPQQLAPAQDIARGDPQASTGFISLTPREQLIDARGTLDVGHRDLFAARTWDPPPPPAPPPPPPAPPPAPTAPPLPFTYIGKKLEGDSWEAYLSAGERTLVARTGAVLEGSWQVKRVAPPVLELLYVPLGQVQTLAIGDVR